MNNNKKTIEEMLQEADELIAVLEKGDIPLEDAFRIYEKGVRLLGTINSGIDRVEKKIRELEEEDLPQEEQP